MKDLTLICCTRGSRQETDLYRSLRALAPLEVRYFEHNREGLPTRYNAVLDELGEADRILVFVHDDVTIDDPDMRQKLNASLEQGYAVAGLAGQPTFTISHRHPITLWLQPPPGIQSGRVRHRLLDGSVVMMDYGPVPRRCVVMDGLFLAVHPPSIRGTRFDERFPFHFYDLDFCLTAAKAGVALGTTGVEVIHANKPGVGSHDSPAFLETQGRFRAKWGDGSHFAEGPHPVEGLARNDPCYCGSGLRFKHCHGKA